MVISQYFIKYSYSFSSYSYTKKSVFSLRDEAIPDSGLFTKTCGPRTGASG